MSGVGSTNAMKKGSGNNPFLAYSKEDMQGFLNSAYTGRIVKYAGSSTKTGVPRGNNLNLGDAQNLVVDLTKSFTDNQGLSKSRKWYITIDTETGNKCIMDITINKQTGEIGTPVLISDTIKALIYSIYTPYSSLIGRNINELDVKFLSVTGTDVDRDVVTNWPTTSGWQKDCFNDSGKITLWGYGEKVTAIQNQNDMDYWSAYPILYTEPYVANVLYKVVYGNGQYYFEEYYHISENVTTATVEDVALGKTFYDFTGTKQTGTGTKINPYLATDLDTFKSFPIGSFIKWLGPDKTMLDETTGQMLIQNEIYRAVEEGDILQYVILPTLSNPADPIDVAEGKEVINQLGAVMIGTGNVVLRAATTEGMQALFTTENIGKVVQYVGETDVYIKDAIYQIVDTNEFKQYYELPMLTNEGTAADLVEGKQLINSKGEVVEGTAGGEIDYTQDVMFWDYDGKLIYACTLDEAKAMTKLPDAPSHADKGLVFYKWNYTLEEVNAITDGADVGALYDTADGKTHLFLDIPINNVAIPLAISKYSTSRGLSINVDWGDGTIEPFSWDKNVAASTITHTYVNKGKYEIKIENTSYATYSAKTGFYLGNTSYNVSSAKNLFGHSLRDTAPTAIDTYLTKVYLTAYCSINCGNCPSLTEVSLYNCHIAPYGFANTSVKHVNTGGEIMFRAFYDSTVETFSMHNTSLEPSAFVNTIVKRIVCNAYTNTYSDSVYLSLPVVKRCVWPRTMYSGDNISMASCRKISFSTLTSSGSGTSYYFTGTTELHVNNVRPYGSQVKIRKDIISAPILEKFILNNSTPTPLYGAFTKIPDTCKYYVPDDAVDTYKSTEGWSEMADRIYPMSALTN